MGSELQKEFQYYINHQKELVEKYRGKVLVIKNEKVIGVYDSDLEAVEKTSEKHDIGTFLVQKCDSGTNSFTQSFHSRVWFKV